MGKFKFWLAVGVAVSCLMSPVVGAQTPMQTPMRVRGDITDFDGHVLSVKTRNGNALKVSVGDSLVVNSMVALRISDIRQGSFVGVTALKKEPSGSMYALEVHVFPETMRGAGEGHRAWDLEPGSTMTNANVDAIVERNDGKELTLSYKGGQQKIIVAPGTPVVTFTPGDMSLLKPGAQVFFTAQQAADGTMTAQRIQVGKNGMKPPM